MSELEITLSRIVKIIFIRYIGRWFAKNDEAAHVYVFVVCWLLAACVVFWAAPMLATAIRSILDRRRSQAPYSQGAQASHPTRSALSSCLFQIGLCLSPFARVQPQVLLAIAGSVILLLLAALGKWPYNFYIVLRVVVSLSFSRLAWLMHRKKLSFWQGLLILFVLIFNPVAPLRLDRSTWQVLNLVAAVATIPILLTYAKRLPAIGSMQPAIQEGPIPGEVIRSTIKYRYCGSCSRRVGGNDISCKGCGRSIG